MPKLKTNRGAKKRFRVTASGKFKRAASGHNHILTKKSPKRCRRLSKVKFVSERDAKAVALMLRV